MTCYALFDTDILYHYSQMKDIDWMRELAADTVVLVYAPIIARQINRHKDTIGDHRRRKKAGDAIRRLEAWLDKDPPYALRPGVTLVERHFDPVISFTEVHLSQDVEDDWLLATAIELKRELPDTNDDRVVVVTGDRGLARKARHQPEIEGHRLRDDLRLPETEDPTDREIRELREQIQALQNARPKLYLGFPTREAHGTFVLHPAIVPAPGAWEERLAVVRKKHPKLHPTPDDPMLRQAMGASLYSDKAIAKYNQLIDIYRAQYEQYLRDESDYRSFPRRTLQVPLVLFNTGGAIAENVTVSLIFPAGCVVAAEVDLRKKPKPPTPPPLPASIIDALSPHYTMPDMSHIVPAIRPLPNTHAARGNILSPTITHWQRDEARDQVRFDIERAKHHVPEELPVLYVTFPSHEVAASFAIDCEINAASIPKTVTQQLFVSIERAQETTKVMQPSADRGTV